MSRSLFSAVALVISIAVLTSGCAWVAQSEAEVRASTLLVVSEPWPTKTSYTQITGTAFPLDNTHFATAAHTISDYVGSRYQNLLLRDDKGTPYQIRQIVSYSDVQDFAILEMQSAPPVPQLRRREETLEQGAPVRFFGHQSRDDTPKNGIQPGCVPPPLTNPTTPATQADERNIQVGCGAYETKDHATQGDPEWIHFNGAAWQGLSGGPLTDTSWNVLGAVATGLGIEPNTAAPIGVILRANRNTARINHKYLVERMRVLNLVGNLPDASVSLPLSLPAFSDALRKRREEALEATLAKHLQKRATEFVITGADALKYCEILNGESCSCPGPQPLPHLFRAEAEARLPSIEVALRNGEPIRLDLNGAIAVRRDGDGRDVELNEIFHQQLAWYGRAHPALERVVITHSPSAFRSNPEPGLPELAEYTDKRNRKWVQRIWTIESEDYVLVSLARKIPGGAVALVNMVPTAGKDGTILQLQIAANLSYACATD